MTLSDFASFVTEKVRQTDTNAVAKCKAFLRQRYELIYNDALWRDALWEFTFTFTPDTISKPESYEGVYFLPSVVDRIVALRRTEGELSAIAPEVLIRSNLDHWAEAGTPEQFLLMPPCVTMLPADYPTHDLNTDTSDGSDAGQPCVITIIDTDGNRQKLSTLLGPGPVAVHAATRIVERGTKPATAGSVLLSTNGDGQPLVTAAASDTAWPLRTPIRLIPEPTAAITLRALVKKKVNPLVDDGDTPELRGIDNCLIAYAMGDMLQRGRQYGKAQAQFSEAGALLGQVKSLATWQEATRLRFQPDVETSSGDVDNGLPGKGYW